MLNKEDIDTLERLFRLVLSWAVLPLISIILSGRILAHLINLPVPGSERDYLRVPLWPVVDTSAMGAQLFYGFGAFNCVFWTMGSLFGRWLYYHFKLQYGVDLGQTDSILVTSSGMTFFGSYLAFIFFGLQRRIPERNEERDEIITRLSGRTDR